MEVISKEMQRLLATGSTLRAMFEEGKRMVKEYGAENVFDFSLGNPSVPTPESFNRSMIDVINNTDSAKLHGYMSNAGYDESRQAIADYTNSHHGTHYTARNVTMTVGAISVIIATVIGVITGGLAGYFGGNVDIFIMRIEEIVAGLPFIPFAMILSAVIGSRLDPTQKMYLIMVVLGVLSWTGTCRLIRAQILAQREMEYVTAAKAMGIPEVTIVFRHILPNVLSILLVSMTLDFATCMLTESSLSYLGFGIPQPTPTWGNLLNGANNSIVIQQYWWRWVFPAVIFGICTICINMIGDGLRDAVDPKSAER